MKKLIIILNKSKLALLSFLIVFAGFTVNAQEGDSTVQTISIKSRGLQRVGNTFESIWLIDNQTVTVPLKNVVEFDILHRFGTVKNGYKDFLGLYAPSNMRLGLGYTPINNLMVGVGFTKDRLLWDFNAKYALLKQNNKGMPVSVTYFGNIAVDTREESNFMYNVDRFSYFHQIMVARKVSRDFSIQASLSLSHFNNVEGYVSSSSEIKGKMKNSHLAFGLMGRYKISDAFSFIGNYDQPLTQHPLNNPNPNLSAGIEIATPLHAFQVFLGNYKWMVPQYNNMYNNNNYQKGAFLIGFNITRLLDIQEESLNDMMFKRKGKKK
jgi:Membrane bound beta barrel domain (DUF5777)